MADPVTVARRFTFVREVGGPNLGAFVQFFQRFTGNEPGTYWCASFLSVVLDVAYYGHSPLTPTASTHRMLSECRQRGWMVDTPERGDLYFYMRPNRTPHHVGLLTGVDPLIGIAGNTSEDGSSDNGTGVFEHAITAEGTLYARLPK